MVATNLGLIDHLKTHTALNPYVRIIAQRKFRSAYAKFRCGAAPINIELCTCRYGLARIPVEEGFVVIVMR